MRIRNLLTLLPVAALCVPLTACGGGDSDSADGAEKMDDAAGEVEHGTMAGDKDSQGDGAGKGGGEKHE